MNDTQAMLQDVRDYDEVKQAIVNGEELIPSSVVYAIMDGENPIKVWREYRGFTQQELAKMATISPSYLSQIETGKREGTTAVLQTIAHALGTRLDKFHQHFILHGYH